MRRLGLFSLALVLGFLCTHGLLSYTQAATLKKIAPATPVTRSSSSSQKTQRAAHIPILMYHYIHDHFAGESAEGKNLTVSPKAFEADLQWLKDQGYTSISLDELLQIQKGEKTGPAKPVVITFDDGYEDAYWNALPLLQKHGFTGVFYIVATKVGKKGYMTAEQIKKLDAAGMTIGSHTMYHVNLPKVSTQYAKYEIAQAKKDLEKLMGKPVPHFCFPYGGHNDAVVKQVMDAGYLSATTTVDGVVLPTDTAFRLPRVRVMEGTDLAKSIKDLATQPVKKR